MASERAVRGGGIETQLSLPQVRMNYTATLQNGTTFFGPSQPRLPAAQEQAQGRAWDYPVAYNLHQRPRPHTPITFQTLRNLADGYDLVRLCIETRKDQIGALKWAIRPRAQMAGAAIINADARINALTAFFQSPDHQTSWDGWVRSLTEEILVTDALSIWPRRARGGVLFGLYQIDGAQITRIIDAMGRTPIEGTAYQQVIKGLPAADYQAHSLYSKENWTPTGLPELIYTPRNPRIHTPYGYSPVEQVLATINLGLSRQTHQISYFTQGNIPDSLITVPEGWTRDQIQGFQAWWDNMLAGEVEQKRRARFIAHGMAYQPTKTEELFGKAEEWLARVICYAFSLNPQPFSPTMNRATAETAQASSEDEGLIPLREFIAGVLNRIISIEFNSPDLCFEWTDSSKLPEKTKRELSKAEYDSGIRSRNEARAEAGLPPTDNPEDDMPKDKATPPALPIAGPNGEPKEKTKEPEGAPAEKLAKAHNCGDANCDHGLVKADLAKAADTDGHALDLNRKVARRLRGVVGLELTALLQKMGDKAAAKALKALRSAGLAKADGDPAEEIPEATWTAILAGWTGEVQSMIDAIQDDLEAMALDAAKKAADLVTYDNFDKVDEAAVKIMKAHGAELVTQMSETTREMLKATIAKGLADNIGLDAIADAIQDSFNFSPARAQLIAQAEISWANSNAALESYKLAKESGANVKKEWLLGPNPCEICQGNAAAGPIELDAAFPSGHQAPYAHPRCECAVSPVIVADEAPA